uniref:hypothetical protein n=1 Tax=Roseomonas rosulenta TaxID=2748667 RepID=UPI0038D1F047
MTSTRALARLALLASVAVLPACGYSVENSARVAGLERDLTASQARGQELTARVGELETTLAAERRARGDLAAIERRLAIARRDLGSAQQGRSSADQESAQLRQRVEEETRRLAALQAEAAQAAALGEQRRGQVAEADRRLAALRENANAEDRRLAALRGDI